MEDRTAAGSLSITSPVCSLTFSLCNQVLISCMPLQATALYAFLSKICLLWSSSLSPMPPSSSFPIHCGGKVSCFLKFPVFGKKSLVGYTWIVMAPQHHLVASLFPQISGRSQVGLFRQISKGEALLLNDSKALDPCSGLSVVCTYPLCLERSSGLFSLWNIVCYTVVKYRY